MKTSKNICLTLMIALCIFIISSFILLPSAFSWDPGQVLHEYLKDNYPWEDIEVSNVRVMGKLPVKAPEKVILEKGHLGKAVFSFIYQPDRKTIVKAYVNAFDSVVKSRRPLRRGHILTENDMYISKINIRKMPNNAVRNADVIIGKSLKRSISANIPLAENLVEMSQVVKRGKRVVLQINHGGMFITAAGKTKEKGYVG